MNHLRLTSFATERDLRLAVIEAGRICYTNGLLVSNAGSISSKLGNDRFVITPLEISRGRLAPEDLLIVGMDERIVKSDPSRKRTISRDVDLHFETYRLRPEIRAVIVAHPVNTVALSVAGMGFPIDIVPEVLEELGPVPTTGFTTSNSQNTVSVLREYIPDHNAIIIRNRGVIVLGKDLEEAVNFLERLENVARIVVTAQQLGKVNHLPDDVMMTVRDEYLKKQKRTRGDS